MYKISAETMHTHAANKARVRAVQGQDITTDQSRLARLSETAPIEHPNDDEKEKQKKKKKDR